MRRKALEHWRAYSQRLKLEVVKLKRELYAKSNTPRTDAIRGLTAWSDETIKHARQLEQELAGANALCMIRINELLRKLAEAKDLAFRRALQLDGMEKRAELAERSLNNITADAIKHAALDRMVDRFLAWPLPDSVCSDTCVTMVGGDIHRSGTNLLTADEAWRMFEYAVYGK